MESVIADGVLKSRRELSEQEKNVLNACVDSFETKPVEIKTFASFDATAENELPSGMTMSFPANAIAEPSAIPDRLFAVRSISKIRKTPEMGDSNYTESFFKDANKKKALSDAVKQYAEYPLEFSIRSEIDGKETDEWDHELGGSNSFVAVMAAEPQGRRRRKANGNGKQWYLVAEGTAPLAVSQFKHQIAIRKPTYGQLFTDPAWIQRMRWLENAVSRSVNRSLVAAAAALNVEITMIQDVSSAVHEDSNGAQPYRACPEWSQSLYSVKKSIHSNQSTVTFFHAAMPRQESQQLIDRSFFVLEGPYHGLLQFPITNEVGLNALPTHLGRNANDAQAKQHIESSVSEKQEVVARAQYAMWDGKNALPQHPYLSDHAFRALEDDFKNDMKKAGWNSEHHVQSVTPVLLKMWNPNLRRPALDKISSQQNKEL